MKREILFRGLRKDGEGFAYGDRVQGASGKIYIFDYDDILGHSQINEVIPESAGQFTGLKDKNGIKIFEGDIIDRIIYFMGSYNKFIEKVIYEDGGFKTIDIDNIEDTPSHLENYVGHTIEVIGNIHS